MISMTGNCRGMEISRAQWKRPHNRRRRRRDRLPCRDGQTHPDHLHSFYATTSGDLGVLHGPRLHPDLKERWLSGDSISRVPLARRGAETFLVIYSKMHYACKVFCIPGGSRQGWPRCAGIYRKILLVENYCVIIVVKRGLRISDRAFPSGAMT